MTNENMTPEEHFEELYNQVVMGKLFESSEEGLCSLIQNDNLPYIDMLIDYRVGRDDFGEYREDFCRLDNHVKSCYFCSEFYAHSESLDFNQLMTEHADYMNERKRRDKGFEQMLEMYAKSGSDEEAEQIVKDYISRDLNGITEDQSEKPENPEKSKE